LIDYGSREDFEAGAARQHTSSASLARIPETVIGAGSSRGISLLTCA